MPINKGGQTFCGYQGRARNAKLETETRPRHWLHQPRRDRDETLKFRDEMFVALETWSRRQSASFIDCNNRPRCYLSRSLFL